MTTLNVSLSPNLQTELAQPGVWAYAVYFDSSGNNPTWTSLVMNGAVQQAGTVPVSLPATMVGGKIYLIVQSEDASQPDNLLGLITTQSELNWANANTYDFRYDSFEVTLQNSPFDAGNLSSVNGFGLPMEVSIPYQNGASASVGYGITGSTLVSDINNINTSNTYSYTYTSGPLNHDFRMALSPTESLSLGPNGPFKASDWSQYVESLEASLSGSKPPNIILSGQFNGAPDASGVWHNGGYFAYQLEWDGTHFWLDPLPSSQIKGHIQLTPAALEDSIYSTLGTANIYTDPADPPYLTGMNTGANNQWGKVLSEFLTGFTGGFYLNSGTSPNSQVADLVDLNQNLNWDPNYAFSPLSPHVTYQTSDPYSQIFYAHSNSYGSGYSDALMSQYAVGGPLISVYDPALNTNVRNINLTIYSDGETPQGYTKPAIYNYIAPGPNGYDLPNPADNATNITLNFASNVTENAGVVPDSKDRIALNILTSDAGGTPTWSTITFDGSSAGPFGLWQNWNVNYDSTHNSYSAVPFSTPVSQPAGTMLINQFPVAGGANSVSWYQIGVGDKTFNLYTTTSAGQFENPDYAGQQGALAIDGLATVTPQQSTAPTVPTFSVNFSVGDTVTYDPSLLVPNTANVNSNSFPIIPYAPVAGILSTQFTALPNQTSPVSNTITTTDADIAFAWTGENNDPSTASWIAHYTNKIGAGDVARVTITSSSGSLFTTATADIDGNWQTSVVHLGAGTYTVTMAEYLPTDINFTTPLSPTSNKLILTIASFFQLPVTTSDLTTLQQGIQFFTNTAEAAPQAALITANTPGGPTVFSYAAQLLSNNISLSQVAMADSALMEGATIQVGTATTPNSLAAFALSFLPAQVSTAIAHGFNPTVYAAEALGLALGGNTAFNTNFVTPFTGNVAGFAGAVATATGVTAGAIQGFVQNWINFYTANPNATFGLSVTQAAYGAAFGDSVGAALLAPASLNLPLTTVFSTTGNNGFSPNTVTGLVANALINIAEDTANGTPGTLYKTGVSLVALPQRAPLQGEFNGGEEQLVIGSSGQNNSTVNGAPGGAGQTPPPGDTITAAAGTTDQVFNFTGTAAAGSVINVASVGPGNTVSGVQTANVSAVGQAVQGDFTATGSAGAWTGLPALNVTSGGSTAGADLLTVAAATAVQLTDTLVSTTTNALTVNGSLTTTITENNGSFDNGGITVNGGSGTTTVAITQTEAANGNDGIVKIIDANGASTTAAGTITTITLDGLSNPGNTITDNALTNLTVNHSDGNLAGTTLAITDNFATPTATTLNLSLSADGVNASGGAIGGAQLEITDTNNEYSTVHLTLGAQNSYLLFNDNGLTTLDTPTAGTGALVGIAGVPSQINDSVAAAVNFDFSGLNGANAIVVNRGAAVSADVYTLGNFGTDINTAGKFQMLTISDTAATNVDTVNFGSGAYQITDAPHAITAHHNYVNTAANGAGLANLNTASQWALIINTAPSDTVLFNGDSVQTLINSGAAPSIAIGIANGLATAAHTAWEFENGGKTFYFDHADNSATITAADALIAVVGIHPTNLASLNPVTHAFSIL